MIFYIVPNWILSWGFKNNWGLGPPSEGVLKEDIKRSCPSPRELPERSDCSQRLGGLWPARLWKASCWPPRDLMQARSKHCKSSFNAKGIPGNERARKGTGFMSNKVLGGSRHECRAGQVLESQSREFLAWNIRQYGPTDEQVAYGLCHQRAIY